MYHKAKDLQRGESQEGSRMEFILFPRWKDGAGKIEGAPRSIGAISQRLMTPILYIKWAEGRSGQDYVSSAPEHLLP
jgi:hypothetical protein